MTTGWLCPKCGSGVAPGVERCPCAGKDRLVTDHYAWGTFTHPPYIDADDTHKDDAKVPAFEFVNPFVPDLDPEDDGSRSYAERSGLKDFLDGVHRGPMVEMRNGEAVDIADAKIPGFKP